MKVFTVAIRGIQTRQNHRSWSAKLNAWLFGRDPQIKFLKKGSFPPIRLIAHSNGAHIALLITKQLIARGCWIGGFTLTDAGSEAGVSRDGVSSRLAASQLRATHHSEF